MSIWEGSPGYGRFVRVATSQLHTEVTNLS